MTTMANHDIKVAEEVEINNELKLTQDNISAILNSKSSKNKNEISHELIQKYIKLPEFMVEGNKYVLAVSKDDISKFEQVGAKSLQISFLFLD